jgi:hypothetical protein
MLIALYEATEQSLHAGIDVLKQQELAKFPMAQLRTQRLLLALFDGVDPKVNDVARNIQGLLLFALEKVFQRTAVDWEAAAGVISTLADGFREIRSEGKRLEAAGELLPLDFTASFALSAG